MFTSNHQQIEKLEEEIEKLHEMFFSKDWEVQSLKSEIERINERLELLERKKSL